MIDERLVRLAIEQGNDNYWEDARKQFAAYERWRDGGFKGKCEQVLRGSIIDYITREVMTVVK